MARVVLFFSILPIFLFSSLYLSEAADLGLPKSLQGSFEQSRAILERTREKFRQGISITAELSQLKTLSEDIRNTHLLILEHFRIKEEKIRSLGGKALERHRVMSDNCSRALQQYLSLMEGLSPGTRVSLTTLDSLNSLLDQTLSSKKRPILGSVPYKNLKYPWREPNESPSIKPAYKGGNKTVTPDDLRGTVESPISMEVGTLAQSLTWNPVLIYEWVKNNIETEWYWGCMKGAEETLRQRGGNDCDQAALLVALLRASGYPARYVRGVIEFYPDIERAKNLTGIDDPSKIPEYFQKAGIPHKAIVAGGRISNIQIEHIWVEAQVPYANYRGAVLDEHGKTWLGLDTSIKVKGYTYNNPIDILQEVSLANLRDEYLATVQDFTPLEYIRTYINSQLATRNPNFTYNDFLRTKTLIPEVMNILPASMQFTQVKITHEYTEIPDELKHKVRFIATRNPQLAAGSEILNISLDTLKLSNQRIAISYEPETTEDQEIINSYGGLDNTPAYLIRLRPVLKINGERIAVGKDGLPMGEEFDLTIELRGAGYGLEKITNTQITGNLSVIGIVSQKAVAGSGLRAATDEEKDAEQLLYEEAIQYIDRWNQAEEELASLMMLAITRPIPTVVTLGGVIDVTYLLDTPHEVEWKGVYVDSDLRTIEAVASGFTPDERQKTFMQLSGLQGSILENRIFEDDFQVESISTAKLICITRNTQPAIEVLTIDKTNINTILPTLSFDENIKKDVENAVNQNFAVRIPNSEIAYEDWTGVGYIKENPETGESGYMLSGMIAGGMTAWGIDRWPEYYASRLENPYSEEASEEPGLAKFIQKIPATDLQKGKVGEPLQQPLQVRVLDDKKKPVKEVEVTFAVKAGGGKFSDGKTTTKVKTDSRGIASAKLVLGQRTGDNPTFFWEGGYTYSQQVGENLVDASLPSGTRVTTPFTAYGLPKEPSQIKQTHGGGNGSILSFAGFVFVAIEDIYANPISNLPVDFQVLPATDLSNCSNPNQDMRQALLVKRNDPCLKNSPTWGECSTSSSSIRETTDSEGAAVQIILGSLPSARYPINATSGNLSTTFNFLTHSFGNCDGTKDPDNQFGLEYVYPADRQGNNINAGKVGSTLPVMARMYYLREGETEKEVTQTCTDSEGNTTTFTCTKVVGNRQYLVDTNFKNSGMTFSGVTGNAEGNGVYSAAYMLKPGLNEIAVNGTATIGIRKTYVGCPSTCNTINEDLTQSSSRTIQVYGVEIKIDSVPVILVDENGYTGKDYTISYTIAPPEYRALTAFVLISKDGEPIVSIPAELQEKGTATVSSGFWFDVNSQFDAEVVLNYGTGVEIRSEKYSLILITEDLYGRGFNVERAHQLSQFDPYIVGSLSPYTDSYQTFEFELKKPSGVTLKIFDIDSKEEKGIIIPKTELPAGTFHFVIDYKTVLNAGFNPILSPRFCLILEMALDDGSLKEYVAYPGKMNEMSYGKMLGQTLVHDVLIQDGSFNLSRQDVVLKGREPQLAFTRSYNNQAAGRGHKPLGEGWSHSLDMRLLPISSEESGSGPVPAWVTRLKGKFYTPEELPDTPERWTLVVVNGTTFKKHNGIWYAERGRHGKLEETGDSFIFTSKDGTRYRYDYPVLRETYVRTIEDRNGNLMQFTYDSQRRLETVVDAVGRQFTFTYDNQPGATGIDPSRLIKVTGPDGIELSFTYDDQGYLGSVKRDGRVETYEYAPEPGTAASHYNLIKTTDANGHSFIYEYYGPNEIDPYLVTFIKVLKSQDVIKKVQYPDDHAVLFEYDLETENKRIVTDLRGNKTSYILNFYGNPKRIEETAGKVTSMSWSIDESKNDNVMTSKTDARGNTTRYEYDANGNITLETDPYEKSIRTSWNQKFSLPETRTDRNSVTQTWQYNDKGDLEQYVDGDGKRYAYTYFSTGERESVTDPRGNRTTYTYDPWGNPDTITEPEGSLTDFDYDIRGRRIAVTDPKGNKTQYTYDTLDYPDKIIHPLITAYSFPSGSTNIQDFDYDPVGNLLSETNRVGLKLTYTYTARDQVKTITRNIGGVKTFDYDPNGNLLSETDWKGVATTHAYGELNQRVSTTNRLGHTMSMAYDLAGNLVRVTDYEGRVTDYEYDKLNRLTDTWQPALEGQERGHIRNTYYDEADPKTNLKSETDQEGHLTIYEYNGRGLRTKRTNALGDIYTWEYDDSGNLIKETDEEGKYTQYGYDKQNRRVLITRMGGIQTNYRYDANSNPTHVTDALGRTAETRYDEWNRAYQVVDPEQYVTTTEYDGEGKSVRVIDGNGNQRSWVRDQRGLVLTATDGEGFTTRYTYDSNGNVETVTDARNTVTRTAYDVEDQMIRTTEAFGTAEARTNEIIFRDRMGNPLRVKDFNGNITRTEYNSLNLPKKVFDPAPFDSQFTETTYYKTGKVKSIKNRRGFATTHEYDALNREIRVTDARGQTVETTYNKVGYVKTVKDKRSIITENFYDDLYRLVRVEKAGLRLKTNEYDAVGNLTAVIDANYNRTEHAYNRRNLLEATKHPDNTTEKRTYDGVGNLLTLTNEENKVTTYTYDKENRQTSVEFAGEKTTKAYDAVGNLVSITRPKDNRRTMTYDAFKRLTSVVDDPADLNLITRYRYDANGNMRYQYDPKGQYVEFTYDSLNRRTEHIQHKGTGNLTTRYTSYDEEGNLKEMIDPNGQRFTYAYDELNRQTDAYYPDESSPFNKIVRIHKEYDPNNNVTVITETKIGPDGSTIIDTTVNHYDNFDRLDDSTQRGLTIDYSYDANGNRIQVTTPSGTTTYTFDSRNRIKTATAAGLVTTYTYYPDGKKDTITYPNGTEVKYTYHPTNRIETVTHRAGPLVISSYSYDYDKNGNRISQIELQDGLTETTTYQYDAIDRLKEFSVTGGTNTTVTEYTFDGYNRKTERVMENGALVKSKTYSYDETNWLTRLDYTDNSQPETCNGSITYTYDNNGNTIRKVDSSLPNEDTKFVYDSRNQLVQVTRGPPANELILGQYDYNSSGLRIRHRQSERGDVDYYYDDDAVIEEHNAGDGSLLAHYRYADRLISLETRNPQLVTQYYHHDALGSTVNLTTPTGAVLISYILDPWGHIRRQSGSSINRHIFTGQEHDENTGLIYFGARYYDPDIARFISQDPYLGDSNTPPSLNRYLYAYSNPTVYVDLYGYVSEEFIKQLKDEGLYWSPKALEFYQGRLGVDVSPEKAAEWATSETMVTSLGVIIIETAKGMLEFAKGVLKRSGEMNKFLERHGQVGMVIHDRLSHGRRISNPELLNDPKFQEAFVDYAKINPDAINVQLEIPSKGLMGVLETKEGREELKQWFKQEFDFTDESVSSFERSRRGWNLILALAAVGQVAKPLESGVRNLGKSVRKIGSEARESEALIGKGLGDIATSQWLADARVGIRSHLEMFREGGSFLVPETAYKRLVKGKGLIGSPDGQFITTKSAMDKLIAETGGDLEAINKRLGTRFKERLYRINIHNPLLHNARLPTGLEKAADPELFRWGGYTSGGMPEAIINQVPKGEFSITPLFKH